MALRAIRAVQWAATLPEWDGKALLLDGTSQGGWQALMAASLVPHATKVTTGMTWGCDWTGQAEYGRLKSNYRPNCWFPDMAYFDAVFAARRVRCPVEIRRAGWGTTSRRRPRLPFSTTPWTSRRQSPGTRAGRMAGVRTAWPNGLRMEVLTGYARITDRKESHERSGIRHPGIRREGERRAGHQSSGNQPCHPGGRQAAAV